MVYAAVSLKDANSGPKMNLLYSLLGHANMESISMLLLGSIVKGFDRKTRNQVLAQASCAANRPEILCTLTHTDKHRVDPLFISMFVGQSVKKLSKAMYFVTFVNAFSGYAFVLPIMGHSQMLDKFKLLKAWLENKFDFIMKLLRNENRGEYVIMKDYLAEN